MKLAYMIAAACIKAMARQRKDIAAGDRADGGGNLHPTGFEGVKCWPAQA